MGQNENPSYLLLKVDVVTYNVLWAVSHPLALTAILWGFEA